MKLGYFLAQQLIPLSDSVFDFDEQVEARLKGANFVNTNFPLSAFVDLSKTTAHTTCFSWGCSQSQLEGVTISVSISLL